MGAKKNNKVLKDLIDIYDGYSGFPSYHHTICDITTQYLTSNRGLDRDTQEIQYLKDITVYPFEYFCACNIITKEIEPTANTYTIHHYNASWLTKKDKVKNFIKKRIYCLIGKENYNKLKLKIKGKEK